MRNPIQHARLIAVILSCFLVFTSCHQEPEPQPNDLDMLDQYLNDPIQEYTISANSVATIYGSKGTVLVFPAEAFFNPITNQIVTGDVTINLIEIYSKADMIKNNQGTNTGYIPFNAHGQIMVKAFQNGQELTANKYYHIYYPTFGVHLPVVIPWIGYSIYWLEASNYCEILPPVNSEVGISKCFLPTVVNPNGVNAYKASMNYLGWVGCGTWGETANNTVYGSFQIDSTLNINTKNTITRLFIVNNDCNSVLKFNFQPSLFNSEPYLFYSDEEIQSESNLTILALHVNSNHFYFGSLSIAPVQIELNLYIPMEEMPLSQIKTIIENID